MNQVHIIHENPDWLAPLFAALADCGTPYQDWFLDDAHVDLSVAPPDGVFFSRMSASSHTRGHRYAPEYASGVLAWLEAHGRRVVNGNRALQLELSKVAQYAALSAARIRTPRTYAAVGRDAVLRAGREFGTPFITKHNRAGKGLGVQLFRSVADFEAHISSPAFAPSIDGITLIQEYIEAPDPFITRMEFVAGKFLYAVRVDTSDGFELCPADACRIDGTTPLFEIEQDFSHPLIEPCERLLIANGVEIAGIEFIVDGRGDAFVYDINCSTNYNSDAEAVVGISGMQAVASFLTDELAALAPAQRHAS